MAEEKHSHAGSILAASRGVAIFIAILWHVDIWLFRYYPNYIIHESTFKFFWYVPLPLFFFLIGISFAGIIQRNRIGLLANAIGSYAYLYGVWLIVYHGLFMAIGREDYGSGFIPTIRSVLLPAPELWFVAWLACCLALCTATRRLSREIQMAAALILAVVVPTAGYKIQNFMLYNLLFVYLGLFLRESFLELITKHSRPIVLVCAPLYAVLAAIMIPAEPFAHPTLAILQSVLGILAVIAALRLVHDLQVVEWLAWLGRKSFQIYIVSPVWVALDLKALSWLYPAEANLSGNLMQAATLPLCVAVFGQALLTIHLVGRRSWLLSPPASVLRPIEGAVARLMARTTIPPLGTWRVVGRVSR